MITENVLNELERRAKLATPRPWEQGSYVSNGIFTTQGMILFDDPLRRRNWSNNIAYIVAACNTVPELITEYRALQKRIQKLEQQRDWLAEKCQDLSNCIEDFFLPDDFFTKTWIERAEEAIEKDRE